MNKLKDSVSRLFRKHLLLANTLTCGGLLGAGDFVVQNIEHHRSEKAHEKRIHNYERTGRVILVGFGLGPFNHYWYGWLDRVILGHGVKVVLKKIAADQAVAGPFFSSAFLVGMGLLEGRGFQGVFAEWREKFLTIYMADWCFWPPAQFFNFYFLPTRFRVVYVASATLVWNAFLSFMKHKDEAHEPHEPKKPPSKEIMTGAAADE